MVDLSARKTAAASGSVKKLDQLEQWLKQHQVGEIECIVPDMAGVAKGKLMPASKFTTERTMHFPKSIFIQCINGEYPGHAYRELNPTDEDMVLVPDEQTARIVPWARDPTAQIIHDAIEKDGRPVPMAPRQILKRVLAAYAERGWRPICAPEVEFYLVKPNPDADYPLEPPVGVSGKPETGRQSHSIDAINEFAPMFDDFYEYCEAQELEIDTLIHESGKAQMEVNLRHGDALALADQVFFLKRTIRAAALRHNFRATFMAKPMEGEPGSAMHVHHSVVDAQTGLNIFNDEKNEPTHLFFYFIGGLQTFLPDAMSILAPYVNSYRRIARYLSAPINVHWGYDNRTAGLRIPDSDPESRRVENRVAGADANSYLTLAASLACGYLGMINEIEPSEPLKGNAYDLPFDLPRNLLEALQLMHDSEQLSELLGERFVETYTAIKRAEYDAFMRVISPWEREFLMSNV